MPFSRMLICFVHLYDEALGEVREIERERKKLCHDEDK